jgi:zinc protease
MSVTAAPTIEQWATSGGTAVYFVAAPEIPIIDVRVVFNAGSARDGDRPGIANVVNSLLTEGAGGLDADLFKERISDTGAMLSSGALRDMAWLSLRTMAAEKYSRPALDLLGQVLAAPRFDDTAIERIKANTLVALEVADQKPSTVAGKAFYRAVYGDHPYASPVAGTAESVAAIDGPSIKAFHERYYNAENAVIVVVGAISSEAARRLADELTKGLRAGAKAPALPPVSALVKAHDERIEFPSIQSHVRFGQPGMKRGDRDYFPLLVGNHVLGGSALVSILFEEVREKRGLSYSASSYFLPMAEDGPFVASLQTDGSQQVEALRVLRSTVERFIEQGPTGSELDTAKKNLIGGFPLRIDSNSKLIEYIAMIGFYDLPLDYLQTFTAKVAEVTMADVKSAFKRRLHPDKMVTVVVGQAQGGSGG